MRKGVWMPLMLAAGQLAGQQHAGAAALSLQEAIGLALAQNTDLAITQRGEDTARAKLAQAKAERRASVDLSTGVTAQKTESETMSSGIGTNGISASRNIYDGGKRKNAVESSEIDVKTANLATERKREETRYNVIKAYYDALEARHTIDVRQETVDKYAAHLENVRQLFSAGSKARIEVVRSEVELSNARQELIRAQNSYEVDLATIRSLMNINRDEALTLTDDVAYLPFKTGLRDCIDYAFQNRKDLQADAYALEQKEIAIRTARAGYAPDVQVSVGSDLWKPTFQPHWDGHYDANMQAGISATWNIFDGGATKAKVEEAKVARDIAKLQLAKDQEDVDLALRQAYFNMREAEKRLDATKDAVHQAEEDNFVAYEAYRVGEGILLDVIDTQDALATAKLNHLSAQYDYARYKAEVENIMGIPLNEEERQAAGLASEPADAGEAAKRSAAAEWTAGEAIEEAAE